MIPIRNPRRSFCLLAALALSALHLPAAAKPEPALSLNEDGQRLLAQYTARFTAASAQARANELMTAAAFWPTCSPSSRATDWTPISFVGSCWRRPRRAGCRSSRSGARNKRHIKELTLTPVN